ncbi:NAD(P)H-hydrate epimerase, partial [Nanoarchaeota archaeon]
MISIKDMIALEDASELAGISKLQLMENAGKGIFNFLNKKFNLKDKKVLIFCGQGNNAGDGFVAARYLSKVCDVSILFLGKEARLRKEGKANFEKIKNKIKLIKNPENNYNIIIDAMLGTGIT